MDERKALVQGAHDAAAVERAAHRGGKDIIHRIHHESRLLIILSPPFDPAVDHAVDDVPNYICPDGTDSTLGLTPRAISTSSAS